MSKKLKPNGFTFKRFFVAHDKSPMKITTDSVLLGAWTPLNASIQRVLDLGTGCGVIALMIAQRLENDSVLIDAIDIDTNAIIQCRENIEQSPFNQINVIQDNIVNYANHHHNLYDLIVSNPPYFPNAVECRTESRQKARYTTELDHTQLLDCAYHLLVENGRLCLVLPWLIVDAFEVLAKQKGWFILQRLNIQYNPSKDYSLAMLDLCKQKTDRTEDQLCMRQEDGTYTDDFLILLKDFYLKL